MLIKLIASILAALSIVPADTPVMTTKTTITNMYSGYQIVIVEDVLTGDVLTEELIVEEFVN